MAEVARDVIELADTFARVARVLGTTQDLRTALNRIVHLAVEVLDGCEFASVWLVERNKITSPGASSDVPRKVDEIQAETGEGPCMDAMREHEVFHTGDLSVEERWPNFSSRAHDEFEIRSVLSIRLFLEADTLGALNLYSTTQDAFDDTDLALGSVFAAHAAVAMLSARREEALERKAESRDVIGRAKGILIAREHINDERAFEMLKRASQRLNVKLRDVAEQIVQGAEGGSQSP